MAYFNQEMKKKIAPRIKAVLAEYGMKGSLSVRNHSTVVLTLSQGPIDFGQDENQYGRGYVDVNVYHYRSHYSGLALEFLDKVIKIMYEGNWNNSDIQTDYFDVGWYVDVHVGRWDKPYVFTGEKVAEAA